jgi:hypothetical protein
MVAASLGEAGREVDYPLPLAHDPREDSELESIRVFMYTIHVRLLERAKPGKRGCEQTNPCGTRT